MGPKQGVHVAVVGAGLSGLRCADILLQHGFAVSIFEGRDRVGGRVHQTQLSNGHWVDMGPNWIHGTTGNVMLDLANETGTAVADIDQIPSAFHETGAKMATADGIQYATVMWEMMEEAFEHAEKAGAEIDPKLSLFDFFKEKVPLRIPDGEPDAETKRRTLYQFCETWGAVIGSPVTRQSLRFLWLEECIDDENLFCAGTYRRILEHVAKPVMNAAQISFNTTVQGITYKSNGKDKVVLRLEDGSTHEFDEVVVTTPLGWLQRNKHQAFEPPLPTPLMESIDAISYGCLEKVYISFAEAFWKPKEDQPDVATGFIQWLSPNYDSELNPRRWLQEGVELSSLPGKDGHATLLFYTYGEQSQWFTAELVKRPSKDEKIKFITDFFRPYFSRLPNYAADSDACRPIDCVATEWLNDDLAGNGSYGNFQVGLENGDKDIERMRHGLPEQGLWFAGEHTAPFAALGTSTGAYWSGEAVGERIVEKYE